MADPDSDFDPGTAQQRLSSLERLEALYRLRDQAKQAGRAAMLKTIEDLIAMDRKALARDTDSERAS
jgi:hypothetical protein